MSDDDTSQTSSYSNASNTTNATEYIEHRLFPTVSAEPEGQSSYTETLPVRQSWQSIEFRGTQQPQQLDRQGCFNPGTQIQQPIVVNNTVDGGWPPRTYPTVNNDVYGAKLVLPPVFFPWCRYTYGCVCRWSRYWTSTFIRRLF